jgi:hypothetical protein
MTEAIETAGLVEPWIYTTLSTDPTLIGLVGTRIENALGPLTAALILPKVHFQFISSRDVQSVSGDVIDTDSLYDVYAVGQGDSYASIKPIAERIHALLHRAQPTFPGGGSLTCARERILQQPDVVQGQTFRHLGGTYRIRCSKD